VIGAVLVARWAVRLRGLATAAILSALVAVACRAALAELEQDGLPGSVAIDGCFAALASRFGPIELDPALRVARPRFARDSLSPSRLFDDPLWTRREGSRRWLEFGSRGGIPFRIGVRPLPPPSPLAGAYRGSIRLEALGPGDFEWDVREDLSIGRVGAESLAGAASALLRDLESQTGAGLQALARLALPRSVAAFGRLFALEATTISPAAGGGVLVVVRVAVEPSRIRAAFPRYAQFLDDYWAPSRFRLAVADANRTPFWEFGSADNRLTLRFRSFHGNLGPLNGLPRPLPDHLRATLSVSVKSGIFRVGVEDLVADVALVRTPVEKGFRAAFTREPDWQLPIVVRPLLRAPLQRPFQEGGALFSLALHQTPEGVSLLDREYRLAVRESWVVRWLGSFGGGMATVFRAGAEAEADRFTGECLWALRDDLVAFAVAAHPDRK
jgi:hypothetical protein